MIVTEFAQAELMLIPEFEHVDPGQAVLAHLGGSILHELKLPSPFEFVTETERTTYASTLETYEEETNLYPKQLNDFDVEQGIKRGIERGLMPSIGNGYSFVLDVRPEGQEDKHIPAQTFAEYFSNRQIPIAAPNHRLHGHDVGHVQSYQRMFAIKSLADTVQRAAANAPKTEAAARFTGAIDNLGDCMRNLMEPQLPYSGYIFGAQNSLKTLISLAYWHSPHESATAVFDMLHLSLGLGQYAKIATDVNPIGSGQSRTSYNELPIRTLKPPFQFKGIAQIIASNEPAPEAKTAA